MKLLRACHVRLELSSRAIVLLMYYLTYGELARVNCVSKTFGGAVQIVVSSLARKFELSGHQLGTRWLRQMELAACNARVAMSFWRTRVYPCAGLIVDKNGACFSFGERRVVLGREVSTDARYRELVTPRRVGGALLSVRVSQVAVGIDFALTMSIDGGLFSWGSNREGQLGLGDLITRLMPTPVPSFDGRFPTCIAASRTRALAISGGNVYVWGGSMRRPNVCIPFRLVGPAEASAPFVSAGVGTYIGLAIDAHGSVWRWGDDWGRLEANKLTPALYRVPTLQHAVQVSVGLRHSHVLLASGAVYACDHFSTEDLPILVAGLDNASVSAVFVGHKTSFAISAAGEFFAWGAGKRGELATGTRDPRRPDPARVEALHSHKIVSIGGGVGLIAIAISADTGNEEFYTWGRRCVYTSDGPACAYTSNGVFSTLIEPRRFELGTDH